ncbi:Aste57867_15647 [Aphanomyces stellatus]|uniref:Aste57867_15647 protein n=1 Tax=Aphanomyces stellatus TaxID=120398 RepID=A0A485L3W9_9STRA|nr:hypothetical protein As57867_015591 [Aphanomyces stellatus]VFT92443.1 Aste57867_15647 [Aphanomyces stellatus]
MLQPERCLYSNKSCPNPRTTKKDGSLHRLCAYHQEKANNRQKQYLLKRKCLEERQPFTRPKDAVPSAAVGPTTVAIPPPVLLLDAHQLAIEPIAFHDAEATLSDRELRMLAASMPVDEDDDEYGDEDDDDEEGD